MVREHGSDSPTGGRGRRAGHRRRGLLTVVAAGAAAMMATASIAATIDQAAGQDQAGYEEKAASVPSTTMPWDTRINGKFNFGMHNGTPPVMVFDPLLRDGVKVRFAISGTTTTVAGGAAVPATGQFDFPTKSQPEFGWPRFPSRYLPKGEKTAFLNGVIAAFIDADGEIVGKPFLILPDTVKEVPPGTSAISIGINDDNFADNAGTLTVTVRLPRPSVTVE